MRARFTTTGVVLALATFAVAQSDASTQQTTFQVTANVEVSCSMFATDLEFGTYLPQVNQALDAVSTIGVDCTKGALWELGLDKGLHGTDVSHRAMANDTDESVLLNYAIYQDPAHTINWGDTVGGDTVTGTGTGVVQDIQTHGEIPKKQTHVTAGGYTDTITATLTF